MAHVNMILARQSAAFQNPRGPVVDGLQVGKRGENRCNGINPGIVSTVWVLRPEFRANLAKLGGERIGAGRAGRFDETV